MRRWLLIALPLAALVIAGWFYFAKTSTAASDVTALLPTKTIFFAHLPDLNHTRDQWRQSDIYKLFSEPTVREFIRSSAPNAIYPQHDEANEDIQRLDPKDIFIALIPTGDGKSSLAAGFRFKGRQSAADQIVTKWRNRLAPAWARGTPATSTYRQHSLQTFASPGLAVTTVWVGQWFFASTNAAAVHALIDRLDQPPQDRQSAFASDEVYRAALAHMPRNYALLVYLQPRALAERFAALRTAFDQRFAPDKQEFLNQIGAVCATTRFDGGKIHDVVFAAVPRHGAQKLTRSSQSLGSADTALYFASLLNERSLGPMSQAAALAPLGGWLQKFGALTNRSGVIAEDWQAAFDLELGTVIDWPENARWPALVATLPVKDHARAVEIATRVATAANDDATWTKTEKNGVIYLTTASTASLFAISPTIALSERLLVAGLDAGSVDVAIARSQSGGTGLAASPTYRSAARNLPEPTASFGYVDTALLYSRLDASLRPLLVMSAAFVPTLSRYFDPAKLPPATAVTKHLSPIVSSQRHVADGYVAESIGPVTTNDAAVTLALAAIYWAMFGHRSQQ